LGKCHERNLADEAGGGKGKSGDQLVTSAHLERLVRGGGVAFAILHPGIEPVAESPCSDPCRRRLLTAAVLIRRFLGE
jgi:hypothetical protein